MNINVSLYILPFYCMPILLVWYSAWSKKNYLYSALLLLPIVSVVIYAYQAGSAYTDVFWATFTMLSYYVLPRAKLSGIFYGLALSVKQFPIIAAPFFLFYIFKEHGRASALWWFAFAALAFLAVNGYFIALNPGYFIKSMLANEFSPLIGIGYGPAQLSFLGILPVGHTVFTILLLSAFLLSIVFYVLRYNKAKYLLFAFPILIFLFNYRLFVQYLYFWLFITLIPVQEHFQVKSESVNQLDIKPGKKIIGLPFAKFVGVVAVALILIGSGAGIFHEVTKQKNSEIDVSSVSIAGYNSTGYINSMNVVLQFPANVANLSLLNFRIVTTGPVVNSNMLLWKDSGNSTLQAQENCTLNIVPLYSGFALNKSSSFRLIVYTRSLQGSYYKSSWNS